ncbi:hypothetical protein AUR64_12420 [Haloprofundus marisrubri]|uniref:Uncharacterized protein n=1 Tax=Haloprofundus marisrubri TaxID=1514971 RepID=A0A0W1RB89_9EURY|nr:hypothetical protein [Haloprofundus marisrubri]KTG10367.1 hypothetical protein AUR64_12420 [Haloprofundus marisrubri]
MLRRLRETGPVLLVPLAWTFATAAHLRLLEPRTVLIAHLVMDVLLFGFAALSWRDMSEHPVLRAWLAVIAVGFGITLVGTYALVTGGGEALRRATVFGWMVVPAVALLYTGRVVPTDEAPVVYTAGGALSILGGAFFADAVFGGALTQVLAPDELTVLALGLVGVGQTMGIVNAVVQY